MFDFFNEGGESLQRAALADSVFVPLDPGTFVFHEGDTCSKFALVGQGRIKVFKTGETGRQITLYRVEAGEACLVNLTSTLLGVATQAAGIVEVATEAVLLTRRFLWEGVRGNDSFRSFVFEGLATRLVNTMSLIEEVTFRRMDQRLADYLLNRSRNSSNTISVSHEQIAGELGTAREVISRPRSTRRPSNL